MQVCIFGVYAQVRRDMHELFRLCCFVAFGSFTHRAGAAANPNGFDSSPPLPPPVDVVNQALAVPSAAAAAAADTPAAVGVAAGGKHGYLRAGDAAAATATAAAGEVFETDSSSSSSSSSSRKESAWLLQELQRRLALLQPPSLAAPSCIHEANKEALRRTKHLAISSSVSSSTTPADVVAVFGLAALLMQCADVRKNPKP